MTTKGLFAGAALAALIAGGAHAAALSPGVDFTSPGSTNGNCCWTLGYQFVANSNATVGALATWDSWNTAGSVEVGLWDSAGNLLTQAGVSDTSPTIGSATWSYTPITPYSLTAGDTYYVGSYGTAANYAFFPGGFTVDSRITFVADSWSYGYYGLPEYSDGLTGFFGGNVILGGVPEPATWTMMLVGVGGLGASLRMRRKTVVAA